ncbi:MAG: hypothetical protein Q7R39_03410 [Dehalococcoidia bacterium]|nr:hypothetical protein [Dehalococcoidia bacterium]
MIQSLEKLPRMSLYILGLVVMVFVGSAYMTWTLVQGANAKLSVDGQLASANALLQQTRQASDVESVQAQLAAAQAQLKETSFPQQPPSVELVSLLVSAARDSGVELGNLQVTAVEQEKVGSGNYNVMRQRLQVRGSPSQLSGFLGRVEKGGFSALVMNNLSMAIKGSTWEALIDLYLYSAR